MPFADDISRGHLRHLKKPARAWYQLEVGTDGPIEGHGYRIELDRWPVIVVRFPARPDDVLEGYRWVVDRYVELCERGDAICWLIDFAVVNPLILGARTRRAGAEIWSKHRDTLLASTLCEARVVHHPLARGVLTAFDWVTGEKWPTANFETEREALRWIARMRSDG